MKKILILANLDMGLYNFRKELLQKLLSEGYEFFTPLAVETALEDEGRLWNWKNSSLRENAVLKDALPENLWFGVRATGGMASGKNSEKIREESLGLLKKLITETAAEA